MKTLDKKDKGLLAANGLFSGVIGGGSSGTLGTMGLAALGVIEFSLKAAVIGGSVGVVAGLLWTGLMAYKYAHHNTDNASARGYSPTN